MARLGLAGGRRHVTFVVASGRDLIRAAPLYRELRRRGRVGLSMVLTGSERDADLASGYFAGLTLPQPDGLLEPGGGTRSEQTARLFPACETFLRHSPTQLVVLQGAGEFALACAIICKQRGLALARLEAGVRSPRRSAESAMGEAVDHLCDYWSAPWAQAAQALAAEGLPRERIAQPGNLMADTLHACREAAQGRSWQDVNLGEEFGLFALSTAQVLDNPINLRKIAEAAAALADDIPIVFPLGEQARRRIGMWHLEEQLHASENLLLPDARGFLDTFALVGRALFLVTDSGDLQDQASFLGVPCLTAAETTDRPVTVERGTNSVVGNDSAALVSACRAILEGRRKRGRLAEEWDGQAAGRLADWVEEIAQGGGG